jgi:hypothetical protein
MCFFGSLSLLLAAALPFSVTHGIVHLLADRPLLTSSYFIIFRSAHERKMQVAYGYKTSN